MSKATRMVRHWNKLTKEEIQKIVDETSVEQYSMSNMQKGEYMLPFSDKLVGRAFTISFSEELFIKYSFSSQHNLSWSENNSTEAVEYYQALELRENVFLIHHLRKGTKPQQCVTLIINLNDSLVTAVMAQIGNYQSNREVQHQFLFGELAGEKITAPSLRNCFTDELIGKIIDWTYIEGVFSARHIYISEDFYTYMFLNYNNSWAASNPADYIKISDNLYLFTWLEERQAGIQGLCLMDLNTMHDVGSFFGINSEDKFECYTFGAKGTYGSLI